VNGFIEFVSVTSEPIWVRADLVGTLAKMTMVTTEGSDERGVLGVIGFPGPAVLEDYATSLRAISDHFDRYEVPPHPRHSG
jgi:hypothetical protein